MSVHAAADALGSRRIPPAVDRRGQLVLLGIEARIESVRDDGRDRLRIDRRGGLLFLRRFLRERDISVSDGTILNKPAPSFFYGVTRAGISILTLAVAWRQ